MRLMVEKSGSQFVSFIKIIPAVPVLYEAGLYTFTFRGNTIRDGVVQREEARVSCDKFVAGVLENLKAMFSDEGDAKGFSAMSALFRPEVMLGDVRVEVSGEFVRYLAGVSGVRSCECREELLNFRCTRRLQMFVSWRSGLLRYSPVLGLLQSVSWLAQCQQLIARGASVGRILLRLTIATECPQQA